MFFLKSKDEVDTSDSENKAKLPLRVVCNEKNRLLLNKYYKGEIPDWKECSGIGIGVPGAVDPAAGIPANMQTVRYVVELEQLHLQTAERIAQGDEIYERTKKELMGTVEAVEVNPSRILSKNQLNGTFLYAEVPERYNVTMEITAQGTQQEKGIILSSGLEIRAGGSVRVLGPGYYGTGYVLSVERG